MIEHHGVVSVSWLAENLDNPEVVIIDCRFQLLQPQWGYQQYLNGHIPNAYYLDLDRDLSSPVAKHGGRHPLPDSATLAAKLASFGLNFEETLVVVYDNSRFAFASRLWWLLRYFGHQQVALLDGGWKAWQNASYPSSQEIPVSRQGNFCPQLQTDWIVNIKTVKEKKDLPDVILLDSRESDRYRGEREPIDSIPGHIPLAINSCWLKVTDEQSYLLPLAQHQQL